MRAALRSRITSSGRLPVLGRNAVPRFWYNAPAPVAAWELAVTLATAGLLWALARGSFTYGRGLLAASVRSHGDSVSAEDGTIRLLLELRPEEDRVEDDVLGVDPANTELLKKGPAALSMERNELVVRRPSFE